MFPEHVMTILRQRYLQKGETPEDLFARVARYVALVDLLYLPEVYSVKSLEHYAKHVTGVPRSKPEDFLLTAFEYDMLKRAFNRMRAHMKVNFADFLREVRKHLSRDVLPSQLDFYTAISNLDFMPSSPVLMNAGCRTGQLLACFVLPVGDSVKEIFESNALAAKIYRSGGGCGFSMKWVRSRGESTSSGYDASGPIPFMLVPAATIESIKQGGARKGAAMVSLPVEHPDILDFITCKEDDTHKLFNNFNISIAISDSFWNACKNDEEYELIDPNSKTIKGKLSAREVFDKIVYQAHKTGDPGIFFIDRINALNPTPQMGEIETCNPCGEIFALPYEACNLASINLGNLVDNPGTPEAEFDFDKLTSLSSMGAHFLDNVLDATNYPDPRIEKLSMLNRKIGLGVMGFADCLAKLQIPYDSPDALEIGGRIMRVVTNTGRWTSVDLAEQRGVFDSFDFKHMKKVLGWRGAELDAAIQNKGLRNALITANAPTGSISILAQCSSSIEPYFKVSFKRKDESGEYIIEYPTYTQAKEDEWYDPKYFKETHEIDPSVRVDMVSEFQKYTDNSISQTINLPNNAPVEAVYEVFDSAYEKGCKCMTVYRDLSLDTQVLNILRDRGQPRKRPRVLHGKTVCVELTQGKLYVTLNDDEFGFREAIVNLGKGGTESHASAESLGRLISTSRKWWVPTKVLANSILNVQGTGSWIDDKFVASIQDAVAQVIQEFYLEGVELDAEIVRVCEICGSPNLIQSGRCYNCSDCGYTPCT